ncbi:MAG: hypothetical protein A2Y76_07010 [Planctomycetes bacterium RBG_13_60_9]|nr:MAG: hypothetical protein A2Y76_07010 [Planctomycetes bacterium RBG_13_60_9]
MKPTDDIQRLFKKAGLSIQPDADERVYQDMLAARRKTQQNSPLPRSRWRTTMKSPITKLAAAAIILLACAAGLVIWRGTGSGIALADVLARVEQVKAFRCKGSIQLADYSDPDKPYQWETQYTNLTSQEYGTKVSREQMDPNGGRISIGETYFLPQKKTSIQIDHPPKKYTRTELDDAGVQQARQEFGRFNDPRGFLKEILACKYENLGQSTVNGVDVEGFGTTDPNCRGSGFWPKNLEADIKIWVDVKTHLPVRYESFKSGLTETGNKMSMRLLMHDFQWDVPVDASEFEPPAVPDGYTVLVEKSLGVVNEQTVTASLKQCVELLGKYPDSVSVALPGGLQVELDESDSPAATRLKEQLKELAEQERPNRLMDAATPMRRLFNFYIGLIEDRKDPAYYGKTVTPRDVDGVLMRWKVSDSEYRVIFGDLHTETVTADKLAELEKALPK